MKATTLRRLRQLHLYAAVFFSPAIVFFAFSGILQTFGFHEAHGSEPEPPAWIKTIASLHKDQELAHEKRHRPAPAAAPAPAEDEHHDAMARGKPATGEERPSLLKVFVGLMGIGLIAASLLGMGIALGTRSTRRVSAVMIAAGLILPAALILAL